jgi:N-sulfoglucosamine sulfohydrolase
VRPYFDWAHAKRPEFELFDIKDDPYNLNNLAGNPEYASVEQELKQALLAELKNRKTRVLLVPIRKYLIRTFVTVRCGSFRSRSDY